jgi:hypothetical protein
LKCILPSSWKLGWVYRYLIVRDFRTPRTIRRIFPFHLSWDLGTTRIELLELKGPDEKTLQKGRHAGFTAKVHRAVNQVRDYDRYLRDPANIAAIIKGLGDLPDESKLAVLIGRAPKSDAEQET